MTSAFERILECVDVQRTYYATLLARDVDFAPVDNIRAFVFDYGTPHDQAIFARDIDGKVDIAIPPQTPNLSNNAYNEQKRILQERDVNAAYWFMHEHPSANAHRLVPMILQRAESAEKSERERDCITLTLLAVSHPHIDLNAVAQLIIRENNAWCALVFAKQYPKLRSAEIASVLLNSDNSTYLTAYAKLCPIADVDVVEQKIRSNANSRLHHIFGKHVDERRFPS
ncbi:MAG: hypothetical protein ACYDA1_04380 [Vulcanimicrobiaceae bacterium]